MTQKTLVIDLDGTLCTQETSDAYAFAKPRQDVIDKANGMFLIGWDVVVYTARGMKTHDGDVAKIEELYREGTEKWLKDNNVMYTRLVFGKPSGDIYVDDKCRYIDDFLFGDKLYGDY